MPVDLTAFEAETAAHQVQPKTPDTRTRLVDALRKRFPFSVLHLGEGDVEDLVDVMECEQVADGEAVPSKGGHFFVLLEGRLVDAASGAETLGGASVDRPSRSRRLVRILQGAVASPLSAIRS